MLMSAADYRESLRAYKPRVFVDGNAIASVADEPLLAPGINAVGISSNDVVAYPEDAPDKLRVMAATSGITFPMLYDETQEVARAYTAACTPDFFLFDAQRRLAYRGRLDGSSPRNGQPLTGADLRGALASVAAGEPVAKPWPPALGCSIKWKG